MANSEVISELLVSLGLDTGDFDNSLKSVNKSTKQMEQAFNNSKKALELSEKSFEDFNKAIKSGESVITQYRSKIEVLEKAYKDQEKTLKEHIKLQKELPTTIANAEKRLQELANTVGENSKEYQKAENELKRYRQQFNNIDTTINNSVNSLRSFQNQIDATNNKISKASQEVQNFRDELNKIDDIDLNIEGIDVLDAFEDIDLSDFTGQIDGLGDGLDLLSLGAKGCGLALAGMITASAINSAKEYDKSLFDLRTGLGLTRDEAEETSKALSEVATEGYEIGGLTDAYSTLSKVFKDMNDNELQSLSKSISILNDIGYETDEVVKAMSKSMKAWGLTGEEALGLIVSGEQQGLNLSNDWLSTLEEYSPIFADMGINATDFFNLMVQGFDETKSSSDHIADVFKEIGLKFTEGTDATRDAFSELGLNFDKLKKQVDDGSITMPEAFSKITKALDGVEDATDRNRLAQEILAGTFEYTGTFAVDANNKIINSTDDLKSAIDQVNDAYDESYLKAQRELDGEWNKLKQTIGTAVLPILTEVIGVFNDIFLSVGIGVSNIILNVQTMANRVKAFFQDIGISIMETFVDNPVFEKMFPNMEGRLEEAKSKHEETIRYIQGNEQKLLDNQKSMDELFKDSKEQTFNEVKDIANQKTQEMANAMDVNTKTGTDSVKTNVNNMTNELSNTLGGLSNIAFDETGNIPKATQENINKSISNIKNSATGLQTATREAFVGISNIIKNQLGNATATSRAEFINLSNIIRNQTTSAYESAKTNFVNMTNVIRTQMVNSRNIVLNQATSIKNIGTNQFKSLRDNIVSQMISARKSVETQWSSIRSTLSKSINGRVNVTRTNITQNANEVGSNIPAFSPEMPNMRTFDLNKVDYNSRNYQPHTTSSRVTRVTTKTNNDTLNAIQQQNNLLTQMLEVLMSDRIVTVNNNVTLDGREVARAIAPHSRELDRYNTRNPRFSY